MVAIKNTSPEKRYGVFLPMVSESRPKIGWKAVDVNKNAVDSHEALLEL
jgi:hypothetical protein